MSRDTLESQRAEDRRLLDRYAPSAPQRSAPCETQHTYWYAVRLGGSADVPWMAEECAAFAALYASDALAYPGREAAESRLRELFDVGALAWVGEVRGGAAPERVGFLLAMPGPTLWRPEDVTLTEMLWWVRPSHRADGVGTAMLDAFQAFAAEQAWRPVMTVLPGRTPPGVEDALRARGFAEAERVYVLEMQNAPAVTGALAGLENKECDARKLSHPDPSDAATPPQAPLTYRVDWR